MGAIFGVGAYQEIDFQELKRNFAYHLSFRMDRNIEYSESAKMLLGAGGWEKFDAALFETPEYAIAFEGEIYNVHEVSKLHFANRGIQDEAHPLGIVGLLYEKYGLAFPLYLNGVFSMVLWDKCTDTLHLCNDHLGAHSLYYSVTSKMVLFGSTVNSLLATQEISPALSLASINQYFASKALTPPDTMYSAVKSVKPSCVISIKHGRISEYDYWNLQNVDVDYSLCPDEYTEMIRSIILDAIVIRAKYHKDFGAIVSGGVDTGIVAATLAREIAPRSLSVFSVDFDENSYSDASLQRLMVEEFSLQHYQAILTAEEFAYMLNDSVGYLDAPVNDIAFVGMAKVYEMAKENGFSVVFEGEGPDEIFPAGNTHGERQLAKFLFLPRWIRHSFLRLFFKTMPLGDSLVDKSFRVLARIAMDDDERRLTWRTYFHNNLRKKLLNLDWYDSRDPYVNQKAYLSNCKNTDFINKYQFGLIKTFLADNLLFKDERMAASKGVINCVPLIDYRLVELALKIPSDWQLAKPDQESDGIKLLYKKALKGQIPNKILMHKKIRGFSHPTSKWFRRELRDFVGDILLGERTRQRGIFNLKFVEALLEQHFSERANYDYPLSSLLVFELWMRRNYDQFVRS